MKKRKTCYLTKNRNERTTSKGEIHIDHWRLCNAKGNDMVMPWFKTSCEARQAARDHDWKLVNGVYEGRE